VKAQCGHWAPVAPKTDMLEVRLIRWEGEVVADPESAEGGEIGDQLLRSRELRVGRCRSRLGQACGGVGLSVRATPC